MFGKLKILFENCLYEGWRPTVEINLGFCIYFTVVRGLIEPLFHSGKRPRQMLFKFTQKETEKKLLVKVIL